MKTIVLVGCGKDKLDRPAEAKDLYTGTLFRKARAYAERFGDEWAILSAKHGLVMPDQKIEPYDQALMDLGREKLWSWITRVNGQVRSKWPRGFLVCLAGELYGRALQAPVELQATFPMAGLGLGERLSYLNEALEGTKRGHPLPH